MLGLPSSSASPSRQRSEGAGWAWAEQLQFRPSSSQEQEGPSSCGGSVGSEEMGQQRLCPPRTQVTCPQEPPSLHSQRTERCMETWREPSRLKASQMNSPACSICIRGSSRTPGSEGWEGLRISPGRAHLSLAAGLLWATQSRRRPSPSRTGRDAPFLRLSRTRRGKRQEKCRAQGTGTLAHAHIPDSRGPQFGPEKTSLLSPLSYLSHLLERLSLSGSQGHLKQTQSTSCRRPGATLWAKGPWGQVRVAGRGGGLNHHGVSHHGHKPL